MCRADVLDPPTGNQLLLVRSSVSSWPAPTPRDWGLLSVGGWRYAPYLSDLPTNLPTRINIFSSLIETLISL